jgi:hypothetical protein
MKKTDLKRVNPYIYPGASKGAIGKKGLDEWRNA